jgi:hypothetical protein
MLVYYCCLAVCFYIIALIIRFKRFVFHNLAKNSVGLVNVLITESEQDEKIDLIQKKTHQATRSLFQMLLLFLGAFAIGAVPLAVYLLLTKTPFHSIDLTSAYSIIAISLGATIAFFIPSKTKKQSSDYSELSQLLHHMALDNYNISNKLFKREIKKSRKKALKTRNDFVIISGLARAGTTSLMNDLAQIDDFVSLNYANMPFLMSPNTWRKIYNPKSNKLKERSHKDGILIGYNSNEALEEYFFKIKANDAYIHKTHLSEYEISESDYLDYLKYQSIIKQDNQKIYLAKNNNFMLRYHSMRSFNDDFIMVILFRNPITQAASLKEKHIYYTKLQENDPFVLDYMNWLGHHEFGKNQKPFVFNNTPPDIREDKSTLDYWLKIWINFYEFALTIDHPNTIFINYETYCQEPKKTIDKILEKTGIKNNPVQNKPFRNERKNTEKISDALNHKAQELYQKLIVKSKT